MMKVVFSEAKRVVVKLGTQVVMGEDGFPAQERLAHLVAQCAVLRQQAGKEVMIVSSGAVGLGLQALRSDNQSAAASSVVDKQAFAAIGQNRLMALYQTLFERHGVVTAQVLLTADDLASRKRYLNLRRTLEQLLQLGVIPIINENDTLSPSELTETTAGQGFGDNDKLSALIASKVDADLLVILTNVDGVYADNPHQNPQAKKITRVQNLKALRQIQMDGQSVGGRGGMVTKLEAARIASISGIDTVIAGGFQKDLLTRLFVQGFSEDPADGMGTLIQATYCLSGKKRWIGLASGFQGAVTINEGALHALVNRQSSLLPIGVVGVHGDFYAGDVISIQDEAGNEIGRGVTAFSASEVRSIQGRHSGDILKILSKSETEVIHRDNLVIFQEYEDDEPS